MTLTTWTLTFSSFGLQSLHCIILQFVSYWHAEGPENLCLLMMDGTRDIWWRSIKSSSYLAQTNVTRWSPSTNLKKVLVRNSYYRGRWVWRYHLAFALREGEKLKNDEIVVIYVDIRNRCFQIASLVCFSRVWNTYLTFRGLCIMIYSYNRSQQDALFLNFILVNNSTYFRQIYCPSLGVLTL